LSGPAVLKLSAYGAIELAEKNYDFVVIVNWLSLPESKLRDKWNAIRDGQNANRIGSRNPFDLPQRLWEYFLNEVGIDEDSKWSELPSKEQNKLIHILTTHELDVKGKTTFKEEFVICGGVDLAEVNPLTMESKLVPNLYFGGEILNIDGVTGGFNFQNAWTSGYIAGKSIAEKLLQNI
jgi:predicted Rossmann fold flavoprotein